MLLTPSFWGDVLLIALVLLLGGHTWYLIKQKRWVLFDPINMFWVGIVVCYIEQPISGGEIFISWHDQSIFNLTLFAILFGLLFVVVGYESGWGPMLAQKVPLPPAYTRPIPLLFFAVAMLCIGFIGYAYLAQSAGGFKLWVATSRGGTDYESVSSYAAHMADGVVAGGVLLVFWAVVHRVGFIGNTIAWAAGIAVWLWLLYLGSRSRLIPLTLILLSAYYLPKRRTPNVLVLLILFCVTYLAVNFQKSYRGNFTNLSFNLQLVDKAELWKTIAPEILGGDSQKIKDQISEGAEFNCAMNVVKLVPDRIPYNYGYGFLEVFTRPIPRRVWPTKRYPHMESVQGVLREGNLTSTPVETARYMDLVMGPAFAFAGHWYYVGGFVGLALGGLMTGLLLRAVRSYYDRAPTNHSVMITYPFMLGIGFNEAAATPMYWIYSLPFILGPFFVIVYLARWRQAVRRRGADALGRRRMAAGDRLQSTVAHEGAPALIVRSGRAGTRDE